MLTIPGAVCAGPEGSAAENMYTIQNEDTAGLLLVVLLAVACMQCYRCKRQCKLLQTYASNAQLHPPASYKQPKKPCICRSWLAHTNC